MDYLILDQHIDQERIIRADDTERFERESQPMGWMIHSRQRRQDEPYTNESAIHRNLYGSWADEF